MKAILKAMQDSFPKRREKYDGLFAGIRDAPALFIKITKGMII